MTAAKQYKAGSPCLALEGSRVFYSGTDQNVYCYPGGEVFFTHSVRITALSTLRGILLLGDSEGAVYSVEDGPVLLAKCSGFVNSLTARETLIAVAADQEFPVVIRDRKEITMNDGHKGGVVSVMLSEDLAVLCSLGYDGHANIYEITSKERLLRLNVNAPLKESSRLRMLGDSHLNCFGLPGDMAFRYLKGPHWKYEPTTVVTKQEISIVKWVSEFILVTVDLSNTIRVWDMDLERCLGTFPASSTISDLQVAGGTLYYIDCDSEIHVISDSQIPLAEAPEVEDSEHPQCPRPQEESNEFFDKVIGAFPQDALPPPSLEDSSTLSWN